MSSLLWVSLGLWGAINCLIAIRLVRRPRQSQKVLPATFDVIHQGRTTQG